jgi:hypothetical protein
MGAMNRYAIAEWQAKHGIEPATGERAELLDKMSKAAFELIRVIELERSGIRDGDGCWHGGDVWGGVPQNLVDLIEKERVTEHEKWHAKTFPDGPPDLSDIFG